MPEDVVIQMPSDDTRPISTFQLDDPKQSAHKSFIVDLTVDIPSSHRSSSSDALKPKPRWRTLEFALYYVVFLTVVPVMVWIPVKLSSRT